MDSLTLVVDQYAVEIDAAGGFKICQLESTKNRVVKIGKLPFSAPGEEKVKDLTKYVRQVVKAIR